MDRLCTKLQIKPHSVYSIDHKYSIPHESYIHTRNNFTRGANSCKLTSPKSQNSCSRTRVSFATPHTTHKYQNLFKTHIKITYIYNAIILLHIAICFPIQMANIVPLFLNRKSNSYLAWHLK